MCRFSGTTLRTVFISAVVSAVIWPRGVGAGDIDSALLDRVRTEARQYWEIPIAAILDAPAEVSITNPAHQDDSVYERLWLNYPAQGCRMVRSTPRGTVHVRSRTGDYVFHAYQVGTADFQLHDLREPTESESVFRDLGEFCPTVVHVNWPLLAILDPELFRISSVRWASDEFPGAVTIHADAVSDGSVNSELLTRLGCSVPSVPAHVILTVDSKHEWELRRSESHHAGDAIWRYSVERRGDEEVIAEAELTRNGEVRRNFVHVVTTRPVRPFDPDIFRLEYYGLSESTAEFLQDSRRYILIFCGLFAAAICLRLLAVWRRKRQRADHAAS